MERICQGSCRGIRAVGGHDATWPQPADSEHLLAALLGLAVRCFQTDKGRCRHGRQTGCADLIAFDRSRRSLEAFIPARWTKVHVKGVAWQINRHRVVRHDINRHQARAPNALYRHLFWLDRQLVLFGFAEHIVTNFFIGPIGIGPCRHRNVLEIILETVIREDGRSDLEAGHYQSHDRKKSSQCLHTSHSLKNSAAKPDRLNFQVRASSTR